VSLHPYARFQTGASAAEVVGGMWR
jgi:hypothetical protein